MMYKELITALRKQAIDLPEKFSKNAENIDLFMKAADAIEKLLKAASAMHTWIFIHTGDEQAAYDECGLTDEMNAELGYGGQFVIEPPKEST